MEHLPTPFTAEQIRDACRGRRWKIVTEAPGAEPVVQLTEFLGSDDEGTTMRATIVGADGRPAAEPEEHRATWEQLRQHAQFPAESTTVDDDHITHPLGELDTLRYTVDIGDRQRVFWFATAYPGMPVRSTTLVGGVPTSTSTVVESTVDAP